MATPKATIAVAPGALWALFGKSVDDEATAAVIAASGKVKVNKPGREGFYVFAKEAGYSLLFRPVAGAAKGTPHVVDSITLYANGSDGYRGFGFPVFGLSPCMAANDVRTQRGPALVDGEHSTVWRVAASESGGFELFVEVVYSTGTIAGVDGDGTPRVYDLRVRAHELDWEHRKRL
jgi:hypothetical protein